MKDKKNNPMKSKSWTVVMVDERGHIKSFRLRKGLLCGLVGSIVFACVVAAAAITLYYDVLAQKTALNDDLDRARSALLAANEAKQGAEVRLLVLESKSDPADKGQKKGALTSTDLSANQHNQAAADEKSRFPDKSDKSDKGDSKKQSDPKREPAPATSTQKEDLATQDNKPIFTMSEAATERSEQTKGPSLHDADGFSDENNPEDSMPQEPDSSQDEGLGEVAISKDNVSVEALQLRQQPAESSVRFQFSLKNSDAQGRKVSGYTFVVLKPKTDSPEPARGSPWTPLKDGVPTVFKRGQYFSISRFKYVRGTIPQIQDLSRFETATVYVYTEEGEVALAAAFNVESAMKM